MLLKFALSALFVGAVLMLLALRLAQRGPSIHFEPLIVAREHAVLAMSEATAERRFALLAALQTEAYLELALSEAASLSEAELLQGAEALAKRCDALIAAAKTDEGFDAALARFLAHQDELAQALTTPPWLGKPEPEPQSKPESEEAAPRPLPRFESASTDPLAALDSSALWSHLEASATSLQRGFWAATREAEKAPEIQRLIERALSLLQAAGPWLAWRWSSLDLLEKIPNLAEHLRKSAEALAQLFFEVRILRRISKDTTDIERAADKELASELARAGLAILAELPVIARLPTDEHERAMEDWATKTAELTRRSLEELAARISPEWRMSEVLYGHPRGPSVIKELKMKCEGCSVLSTERLASAALVHDAPLETILARLKGEAP